MSAAVSVPPQSSRMQRWRLWRYVSSTCCVSSALKSAPIPTIRNDARPKPTAIQCSSCFRAMLLRSTRKRRPQSSAVFDRMCARSFFARASASTCGISSAWSSAACSAVLFHGLTDSAPLSTRENPLNSERTTTPALVPLSERLVMYSSGYVLTASRMLDETTTRACCQSWSRAAVESDARSSYSTAPGYAPLIRVTISRISSWTAEASRTRATWLREARQICINTYPLRYLG